MSVTSPPSNKKGASFQVLGVCGGIGSGKSSACKLLVSQLGCLAHLDADTIAHGVYTPGSQAILDIVSEFGDRVLVKEEETSSSNDKTEGRQPATIDRKALGSIVFADRQEMAKLERIVWPHVKILLRNNIDEIRKEWERETTHNKEKSIVVLEAAVLLDADWGDLLDGIWVVETPQEIALQRLMDTRGLSQDEATKRIAAQTSRRGIGNLQEEVEQGVVTHVIQNSGSLEDLERNLGEGLARGSL